MRRSGRTFSPLRAIAAGVYLSIYLTPLAAQIPTRSPVHPGIAPPEQGAILRGTGPMFQYPDGVWNHGEGFRPNDQTEADTGGWHGLDDGTGVDPEDVHAYDSSVNPSYPYQPWGPFTWTSRVHPLAPRIDPASDMNPAAPQNLRRFVGYLRSPEAGPLPTTHPRYAGATTVPRVDDAAFELFAPVVPPAWPNSSSTSTSTQKIAIVIGLYPTIGFPGAIVSAPGVTPIERESFDWRNTYTGYFSPDGLVRNEKGHTAADFDANVAAETVGRAVYHFGGVWQATGGNIGPYSAYYPICGYMVSTVAERQTELVHQRALQLVQATKHILADEDMTPLPRPLTQPEIEERVVVVLTGGSAGGIQAGWANLLHPDIVHGSFSTVINPSVQRLLGEQEMGYAVSTLSGFPDVGADFDPIDMRNFGQFAWGRGLEVHDLSLLRRFLRGEVWRPACHYVGDEDITSTGTDWIRVLNGTGFNPSGKVGNIPQGWFSVEFAWMSVDKRGHASGLTVNPYSQPPVTTFHHQDVVLDLVLQAVQNRTAQLQNQLQVPSPPIAHLTRSANELLRGIDDPHEWAYGRAGEAVPAWNSPLVPLVRDDAFFDAVQPGAAGTWLGSKDAILIRDQKIFVGGAEGVVSRFAVEWGHPQKPLYREAKSRPLGHQAWSLAVLPTGSSWELVVGTRRHLHKLDPTTLSVITERALPWEHAKPYRIQVIDVLPTNAGEEIVFAAVHGGLVICDANLNLLMEWAEPGIVDFAPAGGGYGADAIALASDRGVVAKVAFQNDSPLLLAASELLNGQPVELERASLLLFGSNQEALVGLYRGDELGTSLRAFAPGDLRLTLPKPNVQDLVQPSPSFGVGIGGQLDLTTVRHTAEDGVGDHLLLLNNDSLLLFNELGTLVGRKNLYSVEVPQTSDETLYTPGLQACAVAVGELGGGPTGAYTEEIVVAGLSGRLMWMHAQDLAMGDNRMPSTYTMVAGAVQPCTNQAMSATWAIATRPSDNLLHVLDQTGNYWQIDHAGVKTLVAREYLAAGRSRGWEYVGPIAGRSASLPIEEVQVPAPGQTGVVRTSPWCPLATKSVVFEQQPVGPHLQDNWYRRDLFQRFLEGFLIFNRTGDVRSTGPGGNYEAYWWSGSPKRIDPDGGPWGNLVEGLTLAGGLVTGIWASTEGESGSGHKDNLEYHDLRNTEFFPAMDLQALRTAQVGGQTYVVLACPGGRVRILEPGSMRTGFTAHGLGTRPLPGQNVTPEDFGHGACALAVRENASNIDVFVGTFYEHTQRTNYPGGSLANDEVATGGVHYRVWTPGVGFSGGYDLILSPSANDTRGGYGVVGLLVDDVLAGNPGDELVVTTAMGDLFVLAASTGAQLYRTWVPGALGFYNSMVAKDLDGDGLKELYVAGSYGLYRFIDPAEIQ